MVNLLLGTCYGTVHTAAVVHMVHTAAVVHMVLFTVYLCVCVCARDVQMQQEVRSHAYV